MEDKKCKRCLKTFIPICLMLEITFTTTPYNVIKLLCILLLNSIISFLVVFQ